MSYPKCVAAIVAVCSCLAFHSPSMADLLPGAESPKSQTPQAASDKEQARIEEARGYNRVIGLVNGKPVLGADVLFLHAKSFAQLESKAESNEDLAKHIPFAANQWIQSRAEQVCRQTLIAQRFEATASPEEKQNVNRTIERMWTESEERQMKEFKVGTPAELQAALNQTGESLERNKRDFTRMILNQVQHELESRSKKSKTREDVGSAGVSSKAFSIAAKEESTTLRVVPTNSGNVIEISNELTDIQVSELRMRTHGGILEVKIVGEELELRERGSVDAPVLRFPAIKVIVSPDDWIATATKPSVW